MSSSRSHRSMLNYATSVVQLLAVMTLSLIASRWVIQHVGKARFGTFRTLTEYMAYLTLLELGLTGAMGPMLSRASARGEKKELAEALAAGFRVYALVTLFCVGAGLVFAAFIPRLIPNGTWAADLKVAAFVMALGGFGLFVAPMRSLADVTMRSYRISLLLTLQTILMTASTVALVWGMPGWSITAQALAQTGVTLLVAGLTILDVAWMNRETVAAAIRSKPSLQSWSTMWALSWPSTIIQICSRLMMNSNTIILATILGTAPVTLLYTTTRLIDTGLGQLYSIGNASWAALSELYHRNELEAFRDRFLEVVRLCINAGFLLLAPVAAFNEQFVNLWMGPGFYAGDLTTLACFASAILLSVRSICTWCLGATGRARMVLGPVILMAVIDVSASIFLTYRVGVAGPLLGTTIGHALVALPYLAYLYGREFGLSPGRSVKAVALPLGAGLVWLAVLWRAARMQRQLGWIELPAELSLAAAIYLFVIWKVILTPTERQHWKARLSGLTGRLGRLVGRRPT